MTAAYQGITVQARPSAMMAVRPTAAIVTAMTNVPPRPSSAGLRCWRGECPQTAMVNVATTSTAAMKTSVARGGGRATPISRLSDQFSPAPTWCGVTAWRAGEPSCRRAGDIGHRSSYRFAMVPIRRHVPCLDRAVAEGCIATCLPAVVRMPNMHHIYQKYIRRERPMDTKTAATAQAAPVKPQKRTITEIRDSKKTGEKMVYMSVPDYTSAKWAE